MNNKTAANILVKCGECDNPAEYVEHIPAFEARLPRYKCGKHKPHETDCVTFGAYMGNKCLEVQ